MPKKTKVKSTETETPADESQAKLVYNPDAKEQAVVMAVYTSLDDMILARGQAFPEFNDRNLKTFIDDGDKRLNAFVVPRESYDPPKEEWQSNVPLPTIRDKQEKTLAGFALSVPDMEAKAFGENSVLNVDRAELAKWLIKGSYTQEENSVLENFWESWECATHGTVVKYEGYLKTRYNQKFITKYDIVTGKVEYTEAEVDVDDKCISYQLPLTEFYIRDFYIYDVQDQPEVAWVRYLDPDVFEQEFGKYANASFVKTKGNVSQADTETFYYKQKGWQTRSKANQIEVVRMYSKYKDSYRIVANGILLLDAPLLWRVNGVKVYPFAKAIWKPFVNKQFFYGNSFPNIMAGLYDSFNTTFNTMSDKQWRSMLPGMLVGRVNQDALDLEDQIISGSTKISVEDVSQVKPVPVQGINNADVMFFNVLAKAIEDTAPSLTGMMANKKATAREIVLADEKLQEMKTLYSEMITDLWRQKYYLRLANIQQNYPQPKTIQEKDEKTGQVVEKKVYKTYIVDNAELDPVTGERGTLAVQFRDVKGDEKNKLETEVSVEEKMMEKQGINYKKLIVPTTYLDNYRFQIEIMAGSVFRESQGRAQAQVLEKLEVISKMFPQVFVLNQNDYFEQVAKAYGDNPGKYLKKVEEFKAAAAKAQAAAAGQGAPGAEGAPAEGAPEGTGAPAPGPKTAMGGGEPAGPMGGEPAPAPAPVATKTK